MNIHLFTNGDVTQDGRIIGFISKDGDYCPHRKTLYENKNFEQEEEMILIKVCEAIRHYTKDPRNWRPGICHFKFAGIKELPNWLPNYSAWDIDALKNSMGDLKC